MTLKEAIESGKQFKRENEHTLWHTWDNKLHQLRNEKGFMCGLNTDDILSTDWILKYDCEYCKDTKVTTRYPGQTVPCPKCSSPKYRCETCKDTGLIDGSKFQRSHIECPDCSASFKVKKIKGYRPIFLTSDGYAISSKLYVYKSLRLGNIYGGGSKLVGWKEEEIEVMED